MTDMKDYGYSGEKNDNIARVMAVQRERYELMSGYGACDARLKSSVFYRDSGEIYPTTGDFVRIQYNPTGDSLILGTCERRSFFARRNPTPGAPPGQAVAANFDYVFIMSSVNHDFNRARLERYLTLGWNSGAQPVVVLTKTDLVQDYANILKDAQDAAGAAPVYAVSAYTGEGMETLVPYLTAGTTIVLLGSSGVGKSSLVNALADETLMKVNVTRQVDSSKGRHTTTYRQLLRLASGVMIIDTPGMRELGMWDVSEGIGETFGDVEAYLGQCKFSDCRHKNEPGCAFRDAVASGVLEQRRVDAYFQLKREAKSADRYADQYALQIRDKTAFQKRISKEMKNRKKVIY